MFVLSQANQESIERVFQIRFFLILCTGPRLIYSFHLLPLPYLFWALQHSWMPLFWDRMFLAYLSFDAHSMHTARIFTLGSNCGNEVNPLETTVIYPTGLPHLWQRTGSEPSIASHPSFWCLSLCWFPRVFVFKTLDPKNAVTGSAKSRFLQSLKTFKFRLTQHMLPELPVGP